MALGDAGRGGPGGGPGGFAGRGRPGGPAPRRRKKRRRDPSELEPASQRLTPADAPIPEGEIVVARGSTIQEFAPKLNRTPADLVRICQPGVLLFAANGMFAAPFASGVRLLGTELWSGEASIAHSPAMRGSWFAAVSDDHFGQFERAYRARFAAAPPRPRCAA